MGRSMQMVSRTTRSTRRLSGSIVSSNSALSSRAQPSPTELSISPARTGQSTRSIE
jgi:hypothetical protein